MLIRLIVLRVRLIRRISRVLISFENKTLREKVSYYELASYDNTVTLISYKARQ